MLSFIIPRVWNCLKKKIKKTINNKHHSSSFLKAYKVTNTNCIVWCCSLGMRWWIHSDNIKKKLPWTSNLSLNFHFSNFSWFQFNINLYFPSIFFLPFLSYDNHLGWSVMLQYAKVKVVNKKSRVIPGKFGLA